MRQNFRQREGLIPRDTEFEASTETGGEPCAIVDCWNQASPSSVLCSSCQVDCDEVACGQIVKVECGWEIIDEVRPGYWTQVVGPFETREQARRLKREAKDMVALMVE